MNNPEYHEMCAEKIRTSIDACAEYGFPNVITFGHWWYSNVPAYIEADARARLQAVPKIKQVGYYSDAYKLEFCLPKFNTYRRALAKILANDFIRTGIYTERKARETARLLLHDNPKRVFEV